MLYVTNDGYKIFAENAAQVVTMLREQDYVETANDKEFMHEVAERAKMHDRRLRIATENVKAFIESLLKAGLLTQLRSDHVGEQTDG